MGLDIGVWGFGVILVVRCLVRCVRFVRMWSVSSWEVWRNVVVSFVLLSHLMPRRTRAVVARVMEKVRKAWNMLLKQRRHDEHKEQRRS